ncbi:MBL fold metallo-hydrolase [Methyloraptor flagellatus]|uniref:MBL fold metallo-hydrolase n=1 Tax=Methyloraptor flagellatus TaxID=3162530 RepID=A0AAU7XCI2_9HYPH
MSDQTPPFRIAVVPVTAFQQNASILFETATKTAAVVDPGGDVDKILAAIGELGVSIEKILITHGHIDHAGGAAELKERLEAETGRTIPVEGPHRADFVLLDRLPETAARWGMEGVRKLSPDRYLDEGDTVTVGSIGFEILHCPGHSPGSVVFFQREARFALMGDVLFQGSIGRTDLPGGDHATLIRSITDKVLPLGDDVAFLPGHGGMSTVGEERRSNPFLR